MPAKNVLPVKGRKIKIGNEEVTVRFTMLSMATLAEKYGTVAGVLEIFEPLTHGVIGVRELHGLADFLSAGLISGDAKYTPEYIEQTLDLDDIMPVVTDLTEAFVEAMGGRRKADPQKP